MSRHTYIIRVGCEPKTKNGSVGFSVFHQNVGWFRSVLKTKQKKNETETERFSVGFSVGFSVKPAKTSTFQRIQCACVGITCDDRIVWCQEQTYTRRANKIFCVLRDTNFKLQQQQRFTVYSLHVHRSTAVVYITVGLSLYVD